MDANPDAEITEFERLVEENKNVKGTMPDPDGYIRYKFPGSAPDEPTALAQKYKTHADHVSAFHHEPVTLKEDIKGACPFNLEKVECPLAEACTLKAAEECPSSSECGRAHLRWLCASFIHRRKGEPNHGHQLCGMMHPINADRGTHALNKTRHESAQDKKIKKLEIREGAWARAQSKTGKD
ncbi:hypothetical protein NA57DRAFT_76247 [Rhizodiscina lignyota]|uniref:Uncharacterized protein n=1 Tax=Rhizodiscina lignyota TaxID=1504668 RepID=A0A9P4M5T6_9PEZI|nr:hypothetical protein NA57DRAFT_76247 [Rhizodiscina lignyota]